MRHLHWNGTAWQPLEDLAGKFPVGTKVTAIAKGSNRIDLFAKGQLNMLFQKWWNGEKWQGWKVDKQRVKDTPAAVYRNDKQMDLFVRSQEGEVLHKLWNGNPRTNSWKSIGGRIPNDATIQVVQVENNEAFLFTKGVDNALWYASGDGQNWSEWRSIGGDLPINPQVILEGMDEWKAFTRGRNNEVLYVEFSLEE